MSEDGHSQTDPTLFEDSAIEHESSFRLLGQGDRIARYVVVSVLGTGGMGVVYAAYDPELDRRVALKLLNPSGRGTSRSTVGRARLLREAQAMAKLSHPNVIGVHDVGEHAGQVFVAMDLVEGETLAAWLKRARRSVTQILHVFVQAGRGLAAAHAAGLVHRDFKPENVMVGNDGRVLVMDFGLARSAHTKDELADSVPRMRLPGAAETHPALVERITRADALLGTPAYMAPEQFRRKRGDARSDQFSFCVALFEALCGERPFAGKARGSTAEAALAGAPVEVPRGRALPGRVRRALVRGLAVEPERRYPTMNHLLADLEPTRRGRGWVAGAVVGAASLGIAALVVATQASVDACEHASARLASVWNDAERGRIEAAFSASRLPYAASARERTLSRIDAYGDEWSRAREDACRAGVAHSVSDRMLDRELVCLDQGLRELQALVGVLASGEPAVVENAVQAVARLPAVSRCQDADARLDEVEPPADAVVAGSVAALRDRLAEAEALERAGSYARGLELARAAVVDARSIDYRPVLAEALVREGTLEERVGEYAAAEASLREGFFVARGSGASSLAGDAAVGLVLVVGQRLARYDDALEWGAHARAEVERAGEGTRLHARLLDALGLVHFARGEYERAGEHHRQAIAILERVLGPGHPDLAQSLNDLGTAEAARASYEEARAHFDAARTIWTDSVGAAHPLTATALNNLGNVAYHLGDHAQAIRDYQRSLEIREAALGPRHPAVAETLNNLANAYEAGGALEQALVAQQRALEIKRAVHGEDHPSVGVSLNNLGNLLLAQGRAPEAVERFEQALGIFERTLGPAHPNLAYPLTGLGRALVGADEPARAIAPLERAVELRTAHPAEPTHLAMSQFALAQALRAADRDPGRARRLAESARDFYAAAGDKSVRELGEVGAWLGE